MIQAYTHNRRGLSLVEVVVSSVLVGTVVVGAMSTVGSSVQTRVAIDDSLKGPMLADMLVAEIMSHAYDDPEDGGATRGLDSGETGSSRLDFDDVDDYHNWSTANVQDRQGNSLADFAGWSRSATVNWADRFNGNTWLLYNTGLKRIVVTVTSPTGAVTQRFCMRQKDGALQQAPSVDKTVVTQVETALTIGSSPNASRGVSNLLNHVEDPNP